MVKSEKTNKNEKKLCLSLHQRRRFAFRASSIGSTPIGGAGLMWEGAEERREESQRFPPGCPGNAYVAYATVRVRYGVDGPNTP